MTEEILNRALALKSDLASLKNLKTVFNSWCDCKILNAVAKIQIEGFSGEKHEGHMPFQLLGSDPYMGGVSPSDRDKILAVIDELIANKNIELLDL